MTRRADISRSELMAVSEARYVLEHRDGYTDATYDYAVEIVEIVESDEQRWEAE